jgi:hypothetical protein
MKSLYTPFDTNHELKSAYPQIGILMTSSRSVSICRFNDVIKSLYLLFDIPMRHSQSVYPQFNILTRYLRLYHQLTILMRCSKSLYPQFAMKTLAFTYVLAASFSSLMKSSSWLKSRASLSMPPTKSPRPATQHTLYTSVWLDQLNRAAKHVAALWIRKPSVLGRAELTGTACSVRSPHRPGLLAAGSARYTIWSFAADGNRISPFNAGIKSLRATLPNEIFYWGFCFLNRAFR